MADYLPFESLTRADFEAYEDVRLSGRWNMFTPQARDASGLDRQTYISVLHVYTELKRKFLPAANAPGES